MVNSFRKYGLTLSSALLLAAQAGSLFAEEAPEPSDCNRFYIGAFGGGLYSNSSKISQMGTALFSELTEGGPLAVEARGHLKSNGTGFGGVQIGYEWSRCLNADRSWTIAPTAEAEGYWLSRKIKGHLANATDTHRLPMHDFVDSFRMMEGVYLANLILSLNNTWRLSPYVGAGVGATRISLHNADSLQVAPPEAGINHFNSSKNDSSWAFAAQVKAGLRYNIWKFHFFGEYRYLFVDSSNYIFGSTVYLTHAHTTPWNVKIQNIQYNGFAFGVQFDL